MISYLLSIRLIFRYALIVVYIGCIMALSLAPPKDLPRMDLFFGADKLIHFLMYFIFSMLSCWTLKIEKFPLRIWIIIPVTIGWGLFMEFMQLEMHLGRSFSWYDMLANSVGVLVGIFVYAYSIRNHAS